MTAEKAIIANNGRRVTQDGINIHDREDFAAMHRAGNVVASILDDLAPLVYEGQNTAAIDANIEQRIKNENALSATIGYRGYRHASCISVNHVVCHGIPSDKTLKNGDILNIDITVIVDGWHGDSSRMYVVGTPSRKAARLLEVTYNALMRGIEIVRPGRHFGDIGAAIHSYVSENRMSVVRDFCGHGLGRNFHERPNVLHFGDPGTGPMLEPGMFFTIEPMVNLGKAQTRILADGWTAITRDRTLSAQYEHSIGVSEQGYEIFTHSPAGKFYTNYC